jgi:formiminotetrahydrofolate cyclodeaminase
VSDADIGTLASPLDPLGVTVAELLDTVAQTPSRPGSGASAALVTALAASLAGAAARASRAEWPDAAGVAAQADSLGQRARALAHENADAYERARFALERSRAMPSLRVAELPNAMGRSVDVLLRIGETAVDVAELCQVIAGRATGDVRADAAAAAALAGGSAEAIATLVRANLVVTADDEHTKQARVLSARAADAVRSAARDVES